MNNNNSNNSNHQHNSVSVSYFTINSKQTNQTEIDFYKKEIPLTKFHKTAVYLLRREEENKQLIYKGVEKLAVLEKQLLKWETTPLVYNGPTNDFQKFSLLILITNDNNNFEKKIISNEFIIFQKNQLKISEGRNFPDRFKWPTKIVIPDKITGEDEIVIDCKEFIDALGEDTPFDASATLRKLIEKSKKRVSELEKENDEQKKEIENLKEQILFKDNANKDAVELCNIYEDEVEELRVKLKKFKKEAKKSKKSGKNH